MDFNSSELNPTMVAAEAFNSIVQQIQCSNLNFMIQLSPFAANISLKKTPLKDKTGIPFPLKNNKICSVIPPRPDSDEVAALTAKIKLLENELSTIKNEYVKTNDELQHFEANVELKPDLSLHQELCEGRILVNKLYEEIRILVNEKKELKATVDNKNGEIKDLENQIKTRKEVFDALNKDLKESKAKYSKEKSELIRTHKAEVKQWRKELGEETKAKIKIKKKLEDLENSEKCGSTSSKNVNKERSSNQKINDKKENTFCSICSLLIQDYIPEYFCGEKFNPACDSCKANDSSWASDDPFSSCPSSHQPVSMVSYWLLPPPKHYVTPGPTTSLIAHCVHYFNNNDDATEKDLASREDFLALFEEFREQLRTDRAQMLAEIKKSISWLK